MENAKENNITLKSLIDSAAWWNAIDDEKQKDAILSVLGEPTRLEYLSLLLEWKVTYGALSVAIRKAKALRSKREPGAQEACLVKRRDARELLAVRFALKASARAHAAKARAERSAAA